MTVVHPPPTDPVDPGLLSHALEVAGRLANDAAEVIAATAEQRGQAVRGVRWASASPETALFDWVTDINRTLERHTRRVLAAQFPDIPVVGPVMSARDPHRDRSNPVESALPAPPAREARTQREPDIGRTGSRYRWLVAPLDGTANYLAGLPWYGYSLALLDDTGPVVGVISDPARAEIYAAARGRGTRVNGVPVRVPQPPTAGGYPICVELARDGLLPGLPEFLATSARAGLGVRVLGSAALAIAQVALGRAVAAVLEDYRSWEVAAGLALALEAGAVVLDAIGRPEPVPENGLLVVAPTAAREVLDRWRATRA
jgi:myo-inositol-1(or 4)-monophosphatase